MGGSSDAGERRCWSIIVDAVGRHVCQQQLEGPSGAAGEEKRSRPVGCELMEIWQEAEIKEAGRGIHHGN